MNPRRAILACVALAACQHTDIVAADRVGDGGVAPYCQGSGPPVLVGDGITVGDADGAPDNVCTGTVAVRTFVRALCTCEDYVTSTRLTTDSFDSAVAPYTAGGTSAPVGTDGLLMSSDVLTIGGDLAVAGAGGIGALAAIDVRGDLAVGGPLGTGVAITAGGDAHVAGNINLASLTVAGTLTVPDTATLTGAITAGATVRAPVAVDPPCACGPTDLVDIDAFITSQRADNQNARLGLARDRLVDYAGDAALDLPCGIYSLTAIRGGGALTLRITGRVALLVDGDVAMHAPLTIELATDDAELDFMIGGILSSDQPIVAGRADHPSRTRLYIGGDGTIQLSGNDAIAANIYAPRAGVELSGTTELYGSLFARRLTQAAPVTIHYDVDVRRADVACPL
ncbi:MAG: hypothetical protein K8W52_27660 [Deltaproteobacteria bacterium]|nr:hypothetical protein [Deltaproteobacteria bacterium]